MYYVCIQGVQLMAWYDHEDRISQVKVSDDGTAVGTCSWDGTVRVSQLTSCFFLNYLFCCRFGLDFYIRFILFLKTFHESISVFFTKALFAKNLYYN